MVKWPNDIYVGNKKIAGILIEHSVSGDTLSSTIAGIGLNVNQMKFQDWPTHPISLKMVTGKEYDLKPLLEQIAERILIKVQQLQSTPTSIEKDYLKRLFRYRTWADYEVEGKILRLFMTGIDSFGRLQLLDTENKPYCFDIKEIRFIISN